MNKISKNQIVPPFFSFSKQIGRSLIVALITWWAFPAISFADITEVVNLTVSNSGSTTRDVIVQNGISNEIEVRGTWIDITDRIEFKQGATVFNVAKTSNSAVGTNPAWMRFRVNRTLTGRFSVTLFRLGGQDQFNVFFANAPNITGIQYFVGASQTPIASNNPSILPANQRIRMVVSGSNLSGLSVSVLNFFTTSIPLTSTRGASSCTFEYQTDRRKTQDVSTLNFSVTFGNQTSGIIYNRFSGVRTWTAPTHSMKVLKAPDLAFDGQPINVFNLKANSFCDIPEQGVQPRRQSIENPLRCANGTFAVTAPTQANPITFSRVTWPPLRFTVKNIGEETSPATTVVFKNGINTIQTVNIPAIVGGGTATVTFNRPNSIRRLSRVLNSCPDCYEATEAANSWTDLPMDVIIDPSTAVRPNGLVDESGSNAELNNVFKFLGTQSLP